MADPTTPKLRHFTLRRGFAVFMGFLVVTLYLVWAGYGAAPTSLGFLTETQGDSMAGMAHGGMGGGMTPEEFGKITEKFVEDLSLPDGSVRPTRQWTVSMAREDGQAKPMMPIDVYLMALRFAYTPGVLRLKHGVPYRFRMMSMDVNHGASIHTGFAGHIMRRPAGAMVDMVMTFPEPGEFMVYCTVYCGLGHGRMKGKIIVE